MRGAHRYVCCDERDTEELDAHRHAPRRDQPAHHRPGQATNAPQAMKRARDRLGVALFDSGPAAHPLPHTTAPDQAADRSIPVLLDIRDARDPFGECKTVEQKDGGNREV
jgi:hypothetical protein